MRLARFSHNDPCGGESILAERGPTLLGARRTAPRRIALLKSARDTGEAKFS